MNKRVALIALFLIGTAVAAVAAKSHFKDQIPNQPVDGIYRRMVVEISAKGKDVPARIKMYLPQNTDRQTIYNEHLDHEGFQLEIVQRKVTDNRRAAWRAAMLEGSRTIQYSFTSHLRENRFTMPVKLRIAENPLADYPHEMQVWLDPSKLIQSKGSAIRDAMRKATNSTRDTSDAVAKIYAFVRGEVKYKSEKGSKDAKDTLVALEADCGGKARLFCAMSRAAGIPSRTVGGIIMDPGSKTISHLWAENYINGQWIPFDVVNNYYAMIPDNYLEIYRGDMPLFKYFGVDKIKYLFTITAAQTRPSAHPWSLYILPVRVQGFAHFLLLIPVGALVIAFFRTMVGVPTFGTFAPILLAAAFREASVPSAMICLITIITAGLILRWGLDKLHILGIPRLSIVLTMVVMLVLFIFVVSVKFSQDKVLYFSFFPMIIMTWMIERFSVAQIEDGNFSALQTTAGTAFLSVVLYFIFGIPELRQTLFTFPEVLLAIMGILLLLGRYTGYRLMELVRFQDFGKKPKGGE
jgi:hypothetical protein